jgi:hypothetical protein
MILVSRCISRGLLLPVILVCVTPIAFPQASRYALRFYGTGVNQDDRVRIPIDDDIPGPSGNTPADVGEGDFTIEFWLRGDVSDNDTSNAGGDVELFNYSWINGNIIFDRDIWGGSEAGFGISLNGGLVRWGTGGGQENGPAQTIKGSINVLDGSWHHLACVRERASGILRIYVDGEEDFASSAGSSVGNLSYPDSSVPNQNTVWGAYIFLAAEKHDAGPSFPSFNGFMDEFRLWNVARTPTQIQENTQRVLPPDSAGLVADHRFEECSGTVLRDSILAESPDGVLLDGVAGNGEWVSADDDPENTAPVFGGNIGEAPTGVISQPLAAASYRAGDSILFAGNASDPEDGILGPASFRWRLYVIEDDATRTVQSELSGVTSGSFFVPTTGFRPEGAAHEIQLTVTDSDGRRHVSTQALNPVTSTLAFSTNPAGIPIVLDEASVATPASVDSIVGFEHLLAAPEAFVIDDTLYSFGCWTDNIERSPALIAPTGGAAVTARYGEGGAAGMVSVAVDAADRDADYNPQFGILSSNFYDELALCIGRDSGGS